MDLSIFFARLLGLYMVIIAADMLFRRHELTAAVKDFASSKGLLVFSGSVSLLLGLAIVIANPVYEWDWQGFVTFLGYMIILRGLWRIAFPSRLQKRILSIFQKRYWIWFVIFLVFGVYLTSMGFSTCCIMQ